MPQRKGGTWKNRVKTRAKAEEKLRRIQASLKGSPGGSTRAPQRKVVPQIDPPPQAAPPQSAAPPPAAAVEVFPEYVPPPPPDNVNPSAVPQQPAPAGQLPPGPGQQQPQPEGGEKTPPGDDPLSDFTDEELAEFLAGNFLVFSNVVLTQVGKEGVEVTEAEAHRWGKPAARLWRKVFKTMHPAWALLGTTALIMVPKVDWMKVKAIGKPKVPEGRKHESS